MKLGNILAVDTSSRVLSVAISATPHGGSAASFGGRASDQAVFEANLDGTPRHSEQLIDLIEEGLKRLNLKKNQLDQLVWGLGPGSFTGLRIGLSALKGFHLGFQKRAFGASSLDLIALGSGMVSGELAVCVDARREHIYTAIYRFENNMPKKIIRESLFSFDQLIEKLKRGMAITGDALTTYGDLIRKRVGKSVLFLNPTFWYPRALFLVRLCEQKRSWLKPLTLRSMQPLYLRASEAEEKFGISRRKR